MIGERIEQHAEPHLVRQFTDRMIALGALPGPRSGAYSLQWRPLFELSELEQAEVDLVQRRFDYQIGVARLESLVGQELETVPRPGDGSPDAGDAGGAGDAGDGGGAAPDGSALGAGG